MGSSYGPFVRLPKIEEIQRANPEARKKYFSRNKLANEMFLK